MCVRNMGVLCSKNNNNNNNNNRSLNNNNKKKCSFRRKKSKKSSNNQYSTSPFGLCPDCNLPNTHKSQNYDYGWCHSCNSARLEKDFSSWTSNNSIIDKLIKDSQLNAINNRQVLEWIPYETLENKQFIANGGFDCSVYSATWLKGNILYWDSKKKDWARRPSINVALKIFENSSNITADFFNEFKSYYLYGSDNNGIIEFYGITQDPETKNFILVTEFSNKGNLRTYLLKNHKRLNWERKIDLILKISIILQDIHSSGFTHRNLHDGNILKDDQDLKISDITLSKFVNNNKNGKLYGVLPYVAPEVLCGNEFSPASDVYSFSMIMWEISAGIPPFSNKSHDLQLAIDICNGLRPKILSKTPKSFSTLMERCWDSDPSLRPSIQEITAMLFRWHFHLEQNRSSDISNAYKNNDKDFISESINAKFHSKASFISKLLDFKNLPEPTNYFTRAYYDSAFESSTNTSSSSKKSETSSLISQSRNVSKHSLNSLGNSVDEFKQQQRSKLRRPSYTESLRKQYQASTTYFYYVEPESYLDYDPYANPESDQTNF